MPDPSADSFDSLDVRQLSRMLDLDAAAHTGDWSPEEFAAILEHQLAAPLELELVGVDPKLSTRLGRWRGRSEHPLRTFSDLLAHPRPPVELLDAVKRFAKRARTTADGPLPDDVATVLYFACIAASMTRCERRITRLDDTALCEGLGWARDQDWVDRAIRGVLEDAVRLVEAANG